MSPIKPPSPTTKTILPSTTTRNDLGFSVITALPHSCPRLQINSSKTTTSLTTETSVARTVKKRTKTGCLTCRKRRIKCDEAKPTCDNCSKSRRYCEGYGLKVVFKEGVSQTRTDYCHSPLQYSRHRLAPYPSKAVSGSCTLQYSQLSCPHQPLYSESSISLPPLQENTSPEAILFHKSGLPIGNPYLSHCHIHKSLSTAKRELEPASRIPISWLLSPIDISPSLLSASMEYFTGPDESLTILTKYCKGNFAHSPLTQPAMANVFRHFILVLAPIMGMYENPTFPTKELCKPETGGLWTYAIPLMALSHPALLHSILAVSSLHMANLAKGFGHVALLHYHLALRRLRCALRNEQLKYHNFVLATALVLSWFEVVNGDHVRFYELPVLIVESKWTCNLSQVRDLLKKHSCRDLKLFNGRSLNATGTSLSMINFSLEDWTIRSKLFWYYALMDMKQATLNGDGLLLNLSLWKYPFRHPERSVAYVADQLVFITAKVVDFSCEDRLRKASGRYCGINSSSNGSYQPVDAEFRSSYATWTRLRQELTDWFNSLDESFRSNAYHEHPPRDQTPFGESIFFKITTIGCIHALYLISFVLLLRAHPSNSPSPAENISQSAFQCAPMVTTIFRILGGMIYPYFNQSASIHLTQLSDLISMIHPVFLAGMQVKNEAQRDWMLKVFEHIQDITGWNTTSRVVLGLNTAWGTQHNATAKSLVMDSAVTIPDVRTPKSTHFIWVSRSGSLTNAEDSFNAQ